MCYHYSIMEGEKSLQHFSPEIRIQDPRICNAVAMLPQIILFHGTSDYSIPSDARFEFFLKHAAVLHFYIVQVTIPTFVVTVGTHSTVSLIM